jgi:predicted CxxxxCH...CXXCH cytochrome family protein
MLCFLVIVGCQGAPQATGSQSEKAVAVAAPSASLAAAATCVPYGAHPRHQAVGVQCASCHPCAGATIPEYNRSTGKCSNVYCHGSYSGTYTINAWDEENNSTYTYQAPYRGAFGTPGWTDPPMTCTSCHANPPQNGQWHNPYHARGFVPDGAACTLCHPGINAAGTTFVDASRHANGTIDVTPKWTLDCLVCHQGI